MSVVIRAALIAAIALAPVSAQAATYVLVCGPGTCKVGDGTMQPAGTVLGRILWDGTAAYVPPPGEQAVPDTGQPIYQPVMPHPTSIPDGAFLARFTAAERAAVQQAAVAQPATIGVGLTQGMVAGAVNLTDPALKAWMDGLVAGGVITSARETAILTP